MDDSRTAAQTRFAVDRRRCITSAACCSIAPGVFEIRDGAAAVTRQPSTIAELRASEAAMANCPCGAITQTESDDVI